MSEIELCRLCGNMRDQQNMEKLFEWNKRELLLQIEQFIGQRINNEKELPQHICKSCENQTLQAHTFRESCIRVQQSFAKLMKSNQQKNEILKQEVLPIEEVLLSDTISIKVENEEKEDDPSSQIQAIENQLRDDNNANDTNPKEDSDENHMAMDEEETIIIEPEIHLSANEEDTSPNDYESKQRENQHLETKCTLPKTRKNHIKNTANISSDEESNPEDDSDASFNPLNESSHSTDEEGEMRREANNKLFADEEISLEESKAQKKQRHKSTLSKTEKNRIRNTEDRICELCGRHFTMKSTFWTHMQRHTNIKRFKCTSCPNSYFLNSDLKRHMAKHNGGELPYGCSHCGHRFLHKNNLVDHERAHTNERPYACQTCGKTFVRWNNRRNHMLTHTNVRAYSCQVCDLAFKRSTHLNTHYRSKTHKENAEKQHVTMTVT